MVTNTYNVPVLLNQNLWQRHIILAYLALLGPLCQTICIRNLIPLNCQPIVPAPAKNLNNTAALAKRNLCQYFSVHKNIFGLENSKLL
ncbi:hypothetical protein PENANT_c167G06389 [Penicillium antarcticum]|uniref:Uncharacterized protein n=1 Tax=Penicillium antarcticum TaxID=416450 RepID=A0A1V6PCJ1_9EURO|nr:hypothetical protein PENANT_c167G06389 [Penicillium antarcticum]